jgi:membrane protein implicated in regulation of membrane protease activity
MSPAVIWFFLGIILCSIEAVVPTAFIAAVMGLSALIIALLAPFIPTLGLQIGLWTVISLLLVWISRRFVRRSPAAKMDATQAETMTAIAPGKIGRVLYEGCSWAAQCDDETAEIAPQQKVYVVARRGTTLVVMPEDSIR